MLLLLVVGVFLLFLPPPIRIDSERERWLLPASSNGRETHGAMRMIDVEAVVATGHSMCECPLPETL